MQSKWFQLLHEQKYGDGITAHGAASGGRLGLTPSFLLGAMRTPVGAVRSLASSRGELTDLLESMRDNVSGELVGIAECQSLHQPTIRLLGNGLGQGDAVPPSDGSRSNLYAWPQYFARVSRDVESLADGLWSILEPSILGGRFSYRGGTWQEFNEDDLAFIRRAFETDDTE